MLTEKRHKIILDMLQEKRSITVSEIKDKLGISESTIRRDLNSLDRDRKLMKVFGGAVAAEAVHCQVCCVHGSSGWLGLS